MRQFNKNIGGTLIVAGTAIGAGMLALPIVSSSMGFFYSIGLMTIMWLLSMFSALVTVEVILHNGKNISIPSLSEKSLGKEVKLLGSFFLLMLLFSVLSAYISGLTSIVCNNFTIFNISNGYIALSITILVGYIIFFSIRVVDYTNRILFVAKIVLFFLVVFTFIPYVNVNNLLDRTSLRGFPEIVLVFFTSFGFHGSIPTVMKYVGDDLKSLRQVFVIGSFIPLVVYILWQAVTLGVLPFEGEHSFSNVLLQNKNVGVFIKDLSSVVNKNSLKAVLDIFSVLAMLTSVFGVAIGLFDYILEILRSKKVKHVKYKAIILTFGIPLLFSIYYPSGFVIALNFAAIALVILAIVLPSLIALKVRRTYKMGQYKVFGGNPMLYTALALGAILIFMRILGFL